MHEMELTWHLMDEEASEVRAEHQTSIPRCTDLSFGRITRPHFETWELFVIQLHFPLFPDKGVLTCVEYHQPLSYSRASLLKTKTIQPIKPIVDLPS